ncbi:hypothetical protein POM88_048839 [Heracleum sosnowskyi]|uniref:AP2/ERF domain-containing protein n=1 Tax=Heracleum sosnowskyi TaxID=360622 RepID=A0AAD8GVZ9_9APIA|nr:hypothetical protein POM88_048839 [Heracleum sosnowskyi]
MTKIKKNIKNKNNKKGCMKGKGGPRNLSNRFRGVRQRIWGKWVAEIREPKCNELVNYEPKRLWLGTFQNEVDAAKAYDQAAKAIYGDTAVLNFPVNGKDCWQGCEDNVGGFKEGLSERRGRFEGVKEENVETERVANRGDVRCVKEEIVDYEKFRNVEGIGEKDGMRFRDFRAGGEGFRQDVSVNGKAVEGTKNLELGVLGEFLMEDCNGNEHSVINQDLECVTDGNLGNCKDLQQKRVSGHDQTKERTGGKRNLVTGGDRNFVGGVKNVVCNDETDERRDFGTRYRDYMKGLRNLVSAHEIDESRNLLRGGTDCIEEFKKLGCTDESRNLQTGDADYAEGFKKLSCTDESNESQEMLTEDEDYIDVLKNLLCDDETDENQNVATERDVPTGGDNKTDESRNVPTEGDVPTGGNTGYMEELKMVDCTNECNEQQAGNIDPRHLDFYFDDPLMYSDNPLGISCYSNPDDEPDIYVASLWSE